MRSIILLSIVALAPVIVDGGPCADALGPGVEITRTIFSAPGF